MKNATTLIVASTLLAACASVPAAKPVAEARLEARSGSNVAGTIRLG